MMKKQTSSNKTSLFARTRRAVVLTAVLVGIGGMASTVASAATLVPEAQVRMRANERWQLLVAGKFDQAYDFLSPGYRAVEPLKSYRMSLGTGASWTNSEVVRVFCNDAQDNCTAVVHIKTRPFLPGNLGNEISTYGRETWIRQDGQWWLFPDA